MQRSRPKYLRLDRKQIKRTASTQRFPSTPAANPPPLAWAT